MQVLALDDMAVRVQELMRYARAEARNRSACYEACNVCAGWELQRAVLSEFCFLPFAGNP